MLSRLHSYLFMTAALFISPVMANEERVNVVDFLPATSSDLNKLSLQYDALSSDGGDYEHIQGSFDVFFDLSLINEFDINKPVDMQDAKSIDGLMTYDMATSLSYHFQEKMNNVLVGKMDKERLLAAHKLINLDFVKPDSTYSEESEVVGDIRGDISHNLNNFDIEGNAGGTALFIVDFLMHESRKPNGLSYSLFQSIYDRVPLTDYMDITLILYCDGYSLSLSETFKLTAQNMLPDKFPIICRKSNKRAIVGVDIDHDKILGIQHNDSTLSESLSVFGISELISTEYLDNISAGKRVLDGYIYSDDRKGKVLYAGQLEELLYDMPLFMNYSLVLSMKDKGVLYQKDLVRADGYMELLGRNERSLDAISRLLLFNNRITEYEKEWGKCASNHLVNFETNCVAIKQAVFFGTVPNGLDIVMGPPSSIHAYYLPFHVNIGTVSKREASAFLQKYSNHIKNRH